MTISVLIKHNQTSGNRISIVEHEPNGLPRAQHHLVPGQEIILHIYKENQLSVFELFE